MMLNRKLPRSIAFTPALIALVFLLGCSRSLAQTTNANPSPAAATTPEAKIAALQAEMKAAVQQVNKIVNQPVARLPRRPGMRVSEFKPGWFHEGASKPDFNNVDVRATRETPYDQYDYVTSDLNPGTVFIGKQLEFNSNTKYFYRDRSIPKKKLTEAEMVEINRLYRIIGRCEGEIAKLTEPPAPAAGSEDNAAGSAPEKRPRLLNPYTGGALLLLAVIILFLLSRRRSG
jgi:hypothetical protein